MAIVNPEAKLVRAIRISEGDLYWCEQCDDWHPGEPEKLGEGFYLGKFPGGLNHGRVVGNRGDEDDPGYLYLLSDGTDYKTTVYMCVNGAVFDSEDWWAQDAGWKCTECTSIYTDEDYDSDEAKAMAEDCCRREKDKKEADSLKIIENKLTDPSVAYSTTNSTTIMSGTITSINDATGTMTVSIEKLNEILGAPKAPEPQVIPVDDVTADAFK